MGTEAIRALSKQADLSLVSAADPHFVGEDAGRRAGIDPNGVMIKATVEEILEGADVLLDLTHPDSVYANVLKALEKGVRPVIGTTGLGEAQIEELRQRCGEKHLGGILAPNFALGAILMMKFAREASKYFADAEIIELHHDKKADAPSGTAIKTAELMLKERARFNENRNEKETLPGARGAELGGLRLHSLRLPGLVAHQEVIFGGVGETLSIRHDSLSRESFMPGVLLAIRKVVDVDHFVYGLDNIL